MVPKLWQTHPNEMSIENSFLFCFSWNGCFPSHASIENRDDDCKVVVSIALFLWNPFSAEPMLSQSEGSNIAMENGPIEDVFPIEHGYIPLLY